MNNRPIRRSVRGICSAAIDPHVLYDRQLPQKLGVVNWNGVLRHKLFATAQWSREARGVRELRRQEHAAARLAVLTTGGSGIPQSLLYSSPYFDGNDPENRDNQQLTGSVSYYLSTKSLGSHDVKGGIEWFRSSYTGGNSQSPTGYVYWSNYLTDAGGARLIDADGRFIPDLRARRVVAVQLAGRARRADGHRYDVDLHCTIAGRYNRRLTFDLGARYERVRTRPTGDIVGADTDTWVPRLAASYDIAGNGRFVAQATYAHYAGKYSEAQFTRTPTSATRACRGTATPGRPGQGLDFAPGFDPANYPELLVRQLRHRERVLRGWPVVGAQQGVLAVSLGSEIGKRGYAKATFVRRARRHPRRLHRSRRPARRSRSGTASTSGCSTTSCIATRRDDLFREYRALVLQGRYRLSDRWLVEGHWTCS